LALWQGAKKRKVSDLHARLDLSGLRAALADDGPDQIEGVWRE
jgi:hypothetical protein